MIDVMLDLETWGTRPGCAVRSIGAVMFDPEGEKIGPGFYKNIYDKSCLEAGLHTDPRTVKWWAEQSQEAKDALTATPLTLTEVAIKFDAWWKKHGAKIVWSQGGNFDEPVWTAAMYAIGRSPPWRYYDTRCTRTIYSAASLDTRTVKRDGTHHNALEDAKYQAICIQRSFAKMKEPAK